MIELIELATAPFMFFFKLLITKPIESMGGEKIDYDKRILTNSK